MPGFVGICADKLASSAEEVERALAYTIYSDKAAASSLIHDRHLILSKSSFQFLELSPKFYSADNIHVWVDGEIYNEGELGSGRPFAESVFAHYQTNSLEKLLAQADGVYVSIIYDTNEKKLLIITDRYGLKPLYFFHKNNVFLFASEVKCFPVFKTFDLQIRKDVIDSFLQLEHFLGKSTWFEGVEVADPSTITTYDISNDKLTTQRYWSWSRIKVNRYISIDEAAEQMASLLDDASKRRSIDNQKYGVSLSGGLDSRAILAAVHEIKPLTFTFGIEKSGDVRVARAVSEVAGVKHIHFDMHVDNWLIHRFNGVWKTDGMLNMYHMHFSHLMEKISKLIDVNLSGYLGDAVLGGSYLDKKGKVFLNQRIDAATAQHYYGPHYQMSDPHDPFFDVEKVDPYLFYNRGRRMIGMGLEEPLKTIHQRLPFMDIRLMDLSYSLPDEFRLNSKVYNRALLLRYPEFFKTIPRASTRVPIETNPSLRNSMIAQYHHLLDMVKYKLNIPIAFTDVNNWIKEKQTASVIKNILEPKTALYPNFTSRNFLEEFLVPHITGKKNLMKQVMGALTIELWFQQILNNKYRNGIDG